MDLVSTRRRPPVWLFALVGVVVVAGFAFGAYRVWANDAALSERGQRTTARVVDTVTRDDVEFRTPDGRLVRSMISQRLGGPGVSVGQEIEIVYDPANPSADVADARRVGEHTFAYLISGFTVFAAVAVALATWRLARASRSRSGG